MNVREFAVLEALNIASTRHAKRHPRGWLDKPLSERLAWNGYEATAEQIADVLREHGRLRADDLPILNTREVGAALARMKQDHPIRRAPLVEKVSARRWRMTDAGTSVLSA